VKVILYGTHAGCFQRWFFSLAHHGSGLFVKFSDLKHGQHSKQSSLEGSRTFNVQQTSQWEEASGYSDLPTFNPMPQFSAEFAAFSQASPHLKALLVVKVHENNGIGNGGKLDVVWSDMSGSLRNAAVWPPSTENGSLFEKGNIIMVVGAKPRREWNAWSVPSDAVVQLDTETPPFQFPDHVRFEKWPAPEDV
jgi:hypothetical protein